MGSDTDFESDNSHREFLKHEKVSLKLDSLKRHKCSYEGCNSAFNRPWKLQRHIYTHTKERPFKCDVVGCSKDYTNKSHLQRHKSISHSEKKTSHVYIECPFPECPKVFSNKWSLKKHFNIHKNRTQYTCKTCGLVFKKHRELKSHSFNHLGVLPFACETCSQSFESKTELKQHKKKHKVYACENEGCCENFDTWNALRRHLKVIHPKLYTCDSCGRTYKNKWILTEHVLSHLPMEQRNVLLCPHSGCERYYFHRRNLEHHIRSFHQDVCFKCDYENCDKTFTTKSNLKKHQITHSEPKPKKDEIKVKKPRQPRKDKGQSRKSMAAMLSGIILPRDIDKKLAQNNITPEVLDCFKNVKEIICSEINSFENVNEISAN